MSNETPGVRAWAAVTADGAILTWTIAESEEEAGHENEMDIEDGDTIKPVHILTDEQMSALLAERERVGRLKELLEDCLKFTCAYGGRGVNRLNERIRTELED